MSKQKILKILSYIDLKIYTLSLSILTEIDKSLFINLSHIDKSPTLMNE